MRRNGASAWGRNLNFCWDGRVKDKDEKKWDQRVRTVLARCEDAVFLESEPAEWMLVDGFGLMRDKLSVLSCSVLWCRVVGKLETHQHGGQHCSSSARLNGVHDVVVGGVVDETRRREVGIGAQSIHRALCARALHLQRRGCNAAALSHRRLNTSQPCQHPNGP